MTLVCFPSHVRVFVQTHSEGIFRSSNKLDSLVIGSNLKMLRVGRFRERQYQLAAQRQNEAYRRYNCYQQTARYFERESGIARHFDSWNLKKPDLVERIEKTRKAERLLIRREKLRALLRDEDEQYRRELERLAKRRPEPAPTLDVLRQKLKEKRAEQSLYLPQACRRYQSYFVAPKDAVRKHWSLHGSADLQRPMPCRDSTNIRHSYPQRGSTMESVNATNDKKEQKEQKAAGMPSSQLDDLIDHNRLGSRYSTRSQHSLKNTNVTSAEEYVRQNEQSDNSNHNPHLEHAMDVKTQKETEECQVNSNLCQAMQDETDKLEETKESAGQGTRTPTSDEVDDADAKARKDVKDLQKVDHRQFVGERSLPWLRMDPHEQNLSEEMFLYLTHNKMRQKMDDLAKREQHACNNHCWDVALRLRDMRNRLELAREKRMFNMEGLRVDDDVKTIALKNIQQREQELNGREYACADSTMYSDEAKDLWKKWVQEDDASVMKEARHQRETLIKKLEDKWRDLAIDDKEKITKSFQKTIQNSVI